MQPIPLSQAQEIGETLIRIWNDQAVWSQATFGHDDVRGPRGPALHLQKEADEIVAAPYDIVEKADAFNLLLDMTRRSGESLQALLAASDAKLRINMKREWPIPTDPNAAVYHTKEPA